MSLSSHHHFTELSLFNEGRGVTDFYPFELALAPGCLHLIQRLLMCLLSYSTSLLPLLPLSACYLILSVLERHFTIETRAGI